MTSLSDTLTVGLVLVLLFGSIALYLYTRIQQAEQKISLLESILLDLKMSSEIKSYTELPASETVLNNVEVISNTTTSYKPFEEVSIESASSLTEYTPLDDVVGTESKHSSRPASPMAMNDESEYTSDATIKTYSNTVSETVKDEGSVILKPVVNYEGMSLKELQTLAKSRGITSANSMKKVSLVEALKTSDKVTLTIEPGSASGTSSFLETSTLLVGVDA